MENKNQTEQKRNENLIKYHEKNPKLAITKLARIFHISPTRVRQILKDKIIAPDGNESDKKA